MSLRLKLVLALVALSASATVVVGVFSYRTTSQQLTLSLALAPSGAVSVNWRPSFGNDRKEELYEAENIYILPETPPAWAMQPQGIAPAESQDI